MSETRIDLAPVESVTITTLVDNYFDLNLLDQGPAKRSGFPTTDTPRLPASLVEQGEIGDFPLAEHGFSAMITIPSSDGERRVLFDTGMTPDGLVGNMRRLGHSPKDIEAIVLSHGHFDHTTGMDGIVRALGRPNLPVYLHPESWSRRRIMLPGREPFEIPTPSKSAIRGAGFEIVENERPSFLFDRSLLITGEVDRTTDFEKGIPYFHQAKRDGEWQEDPLILDDQAAIVNVSGKGLVVLTGCGHAGIVNILRYAQKLTGVESIYAVIGGFHLGQSVDAFILTTCDALAEMNPQVIVPAHCTGRRATDALAARFPNAFIQNSVGTSFAL